MPEITKLMNTDVVTVEKGTPVTEAIKKLVRNNFTGLPVVDSQNQVIGIISEKDILALAVNQNEEPNYLIDNNLMVEDFMTTPAVTIDANESLTALCSCLMKNEFRRLPVILKNKLVGIVTRKDIIAYILDIQT